LLAKDYDGQTAFQVAAVRCNTEVLEEIWKLAKDELTTDELIENLLLAKDNAERTVWHDAAEKGHTEVLEILWEFSKK
jgi:ankyrin repeat protein